MIKSFLQQIVLFCIVILLFSCSSTNNKPLLIEFSSDSAAVVFSHIDQSGLLHLQQSGADGAVLKSLVSVLETPTEQDTAFVERPVNGKFKITDTTLVFIPEYPFVKGRSYLVTTHLNARFGDVKILLKGGLKSNVQPTAKLLRR